MAEPPPAARHLRRLRARPAATRSGAPSRRARSRRSSTPPASRRSRCRCTGRADGLPDRRPARRPVRPRGPADPRRGRSSSGRALGRPHPAGLRRRRDTVECSHGRDPRSDHRDGDPVRRRRRDRPRRGPRASPATWSSTAPTGSSSPAPPASRRRSPTTRSCAARRRARRGRRRGDRDRGHRLERHRVTRSADRARRASVGADAVLVVTPYYNKPNRAGLRAHFAAVSEAAGETPIVLYNIPSRCVINLPPELLAELAAENDERGRGQAGQQRRARARSRGSRSSPATTTSSPARSSSAAPAASSSPRTSSAPQMRELYDAAGAGDARARARRSTRELRADLRGDDRDRQPDPGEGGARAARA